MNKHRSTLPILGGFKKTQEFLMSQQLSEKLNLDVSPEVARALHRVVRAMHDGHCPKCGYLGPSEDFQRQYAPAPRKLVIADHVCPDCGFRITWEEAKAALVAFQPFMKANVELFERWRSGEAVSGQ